MLKTDVASPTWMHFSSSSVKDFNSRKKILNQVMEALKNEKVSVTAICGMGGIGKTTMAKEVAKRAKDEKLFGEVVMVTVSQNPNVPQIQGKIADFLDLKLDEESEEGRADRLRQRIWQKIKNILVILDDLWKELDLESVGIPNGCKILLTSRDKDVCERMKSQKIFAMEVLSDDEAWILFEKVAGISDRTRTHGLYDVAEKVAKECKGLPIAIVTVGRALENKGKRVWNDALLKLEKSIPDSKLETDLQVYSLIKLSYDLLRSEEAKSCFLLCCLFPEDYDIGIETLVRYGKGLRLFEETGTMEQTRNRVHTLVGYLKRCFLLMDGNQKECVRMHDIVRDVAISIASRKEHGGFVVKCDNEMEVWPEIDSSEMEDCTAISLVFNKGIKKHPDNLACPKLKLLSLSSTIKKYSRGKLELSDNFFGRIKEIKVLAFQRIYIQSLPASLRMLQNLRTMHLEYCKLGDISRIGGSVKLEILSLIGSEIEELPKEIGNLKHLKVLDMTGCYGLERIPCGVLSRLTTLEELKIFPFSSWSSLEGNEEKTSASLDEIIPRDVRVKKCEDLELDGVYDLKNLLPHFAEEEQDGFPWLRTLDVFNCNDMEYVVKFTSNNNRTDLHVPDIFPLLKGIFHYNSQEIINTSHLTKDIDHNHQVEEKWLKNLDKLEVGWCDSLEVVFDYGEGPLAPALNKLKSLRLYGLTNLMHIWKKGPQQVKTVCFQNLKTLSLYSCPSLRYLFTASIAKVLVMLESLQVTKCTSMEEVVARAEEEINNVNVESYVVSFSHLVSLNWIIWIISTVSVYNLMLLNSHP
nr:disease resistance protein At4g27190-like [Ziziphus jujuba var. spinosa]